MDLYTDNISAERIIKVTIDYPLSLHMCAELLEMLGPLAEKLSPQGLINWLKTKIEEE